MRDAFRLFRHDRVADAAGTAATLRNLVDAASEDPSHWHGFGSEPALRSEAVLMARDDLLDVARRLTCARDLAPALIECAEWLAWSPNSPVCSEPAADADVPDIAARLRAAMTSSR
jgi:hypothetical protein